MSGFRIRPQPVTGPIRERRGEEGGSSLADGYRKAEPYLAASSTLIASVIGLTALGYWLDRRMGHSVPWLLLVGAVVGMVVGFVSFFRQVLGAGTSPNVQTRRHAGPSRSRDETGAPHR